MGEARSAGWGDGFAGACGHRQDTDTSSWTASTDTFGLLPIPIDSNFLRYELIGRILSDGFLTTFPRAWLPGDLTTFFHILLLANMRSNGGRLV
jgi:hypothetical protein